MELRDHMRRDQYAKSPCPQISSSRHSRSQSAIVKVTNKYFNRLIWLLVPLALMIIFAFGARYLVEHTDGLQHQRILRPPNMRAKAAITSSVWGC
jgi:hypothetical protein